MKVDANNFNDLMGALRSHPDCRALIVWVDEDAADYQPDTVDWGAVEDRGVEAGHEAMQWTAELLEAEDE